MTVKVIVTDMDGTFLNDAKQYDRSRFLAQFAQLQQQGIEFVVASGNQYYQLISFFPEIRDRISFVAENGALVVQSTSPWFAPKSFWCIDATLRAAGFSTHPYHAQVPSFGEWGFNLATRRPGFVPPESYPVPTRFLDADSTRLMFSFPPDMRPLPVEPNHLNTQALVHYFEEDWGKVIR